jgi:putative restriction endonuclease
VDEARIRELFSSIEVWRRGGERAPHKPLLLLYALARCARGKPREIPFRQVDPDLKQLLHEFGPARKAYHPEYPFWRLQNDGLWELVGAKDLESRKSNTDAKKSELLRHDVAGRFTAPIYEALSKDRSLLVAVARQILDQSFPESIHEDILAAVGLDVSLDVRQRPKRDPKFREAVMRAYEYRCAICEFDVRLGTTPVGLEAAHIMWHQAGGPDTEPNGLALCALHHKLFDRGAFTVSTEMDILLSEHLHGHGGFDRHLLEFHGKPIRRPPNPNYLPGERFLSWHHQEVFRSPPRWTPAGS